MGRDHPRRGGRPRGSTRERILDAALDLFTDRGYDKTSLREIAETLGFTKAALYYHFERKEDILLALHLRLHQLGNDALARLGSFDGAGPDLAGWSALLDRFIAQVLDNRKLYLFHLRNFNALTNALAGTHDHTEHDDLEEQLTKFLGNPAIPPAARVRMACAMGAVFGALMRWGDAFSDLELDELGELVRQTVDDIIKPAGDGPGRRRPSRR